MRKLIFTGVLCISLVLCAAPSSGGSSAPKRITAEQASEAILLHEQNTRSSLDFVRVGGCRWLTKSWLCRVTVDLADSSVFADGEKVESTWNTYHRATGWGCHVTVIDADAWAFVGGHIYSTYRVCRRAAGRVSP